MKRIDTMSIRDILRHHHDLGLPRAEIAVAVSVSAGTVSNVPERAQAAGLSWPLPSDLDDDGLRARLYPPAARESGYAQPDRDGVLRELRAKRKRRRVHATRRTLWEEYVGGRKSLRIGAIGGIRRKGTEDGGISRGCGASSTAGASRRADESLCESGLEATVNRLETMIFGAFQGC